MLVKIPNGYHLFHELSHITMGPHFDALKPLDGKKISVKFKVGKKWKVKRKLVAFFRPMCECCPPYIRLLDPSS